MISQRLTTAGARLALALTLALTLAGCAPRQSAPAAPPAPAQVPPGATASPGAPTPASAAPPVRAIGLSHEDYLARRGERDALAAELRARGVNMVGLTVGRLDWTYFPWPGHEERWSGDVRASGIDYLGEASAQLASWAHVTAVVDVFVGRYLEERPAAAARSPEGAPSAFQVSTVELVEGQFGRELLELIEHVAASYPVDSLALTELFYDQYGYGDDDLAAYRAHSGRGDWPRDGDGAIDTGHRSIGEWRSQALSRFVAEAAAVAHRHGKELFVDVRVSWGDLASEGRESGQDYERFLAHADRLVLWNYFGLSAYGPAYTSEIAAAVERYGPARVIISLGLWADGDAVVPPDELDEALAAVGASPIPNSWVTPSHMLSDAHWAVIAERWREP